MSTWLLIVWFSSTANYSYSVSTVGEFTTQRSCEVALATFIAEGRSLYPKGVCLEKPLNKKEQGK
jgi:hypothetical protein